MMNIISLGAGVQSSTMALMAAHGEITPMPDCAIFANPRNELVATYSYLSHLEKQLSFPVIHVSAGDLAQDILSGNRVATPPFFTESGMLWRQCTTEYKIQPIQKEIRRQLENGDVCSLWLGISTDEAHRMRPSRIKSVANRYPLIELDFSRSKCERWLNQHGYSIPPKSSCFFCPYHSDSNWRDIKINHPQDFSNAVRFDKEIRNMLPKVKESVYLHRSHLPLDQVDFRTAEDAGQMSMFGNDCEGMCGV